MIIWKSDFLRPSIIFVFWPLPTSIGNQRGRRRRWWKIRRGKWGKVWKRFDNSYTQVQKFRFFSISRLNFRYFKYIALMPFLPAVTSHLYQICSLAFFSIILFVSQLQASDSIFSRFLKLITLSLTLTLAGGLFEYHSP